MTALAVLAALLSPALASAQDRGPGQASFELRPHCVEQEELKNGFGGPMPEVDQLLKVGSGRCPNFLVIDPERHETPLSPPGTTLDMDLVLINPTKAVVSRVSAWISYDPTVLQGISIEALPTFGNAIPGQNDFAPQEGFIKVGMNAKKRNAMEEIRIARIQMQVNPTAAASTLLSFTTDERTNAIQGGTTGEIRVLGPRQSSLVVRVGTGENPPSSSAAPASSQAVSSTGSSLASVSSSEMPVSSESVSSASSTGSQVSSSSEASSVSSASSSSAPASSEPTHAAAPPSTPFPLLQVLHLRATTEGTTIYAAWDALQSPELAGYHLYYSTVSGRYIQRRAVPRGDSSVSLRGMRDGKTYYLAVRGVNLEGKETEFSQEVSVTVGDPLSSTSPLTASTIAPADPQTDTVITGETGLPSPILLFMLAGAVVGTGFAFRRQLLVATTQR